MKANMDRRSFLAASAVAAAGLAAVGCSPENEVESVEEVDTPIWKVDPELTSETGKWMQAPCKWNCGGMCRNRVYVEDGIVIRQKTDDDPEDDINGNVQRRACPRGLSRAQMVLGESRLKYPMKRKNWQPGGTDFHGELRGKDEWERISWDEAIELAAKEMLRIRDTYGNASIWQGGLAHAPHFWYQAFGGFLGAVETASFGTAVRAHEALGISQGIALPETNDRFDFINIDNVILYGMNSAWASNPQAVFYLKNLMKEDANYVYVGPSYNLTANAVNARWIQVRPGTDTPFLMAVAYEMFEMDEAEGRGSAIDWDYLETYTYGIDGDHMAPGVEADENFRDYLYGAYDGIVKDAEWASAICGADPADIRYYAELQRKGNKTYTFFSYAAARCFDSDYWMTLMYTVAFMGGHVGKSGEGCSEAYSAGAFRQTTPIGLVDVGMPEKFMVGSPVTDSVNVAVAWNAALTGEEVNLGEVGYALAGERRMGTIDLHAILSFAKNTMLTIADNKKAVEVFRKVDFVLAYGWSFRPECQYADIVFPIITQWEEDYADVFTNGWNTYQDPEAFYLEKRVVEPLYEAKDPEEINDLLAAAMGYDRDTDYPHRTRKQQSFRHMFDAKFLDIDGEWKKIVTITQDDIDRWEMNGFEDVEPQEGIAPLTEIEERGCFKLPRQRGDAYSTYRAYQTYIDDPENNPRNTPSGRWEIHSQVYADFLNLMPYTPDFTWKPYPVYKPAMRGYEERTEETPFQLYNPHYLRRQHSTNDENPHMREAFTQPLFMNAQDAEKLGIAQGDTVRVSNQFGAVLRRATLLNTIMPGCCALPHGAWVDWDEENDVDRAGNANVLNGTGSSGMGVSGYNTTLVNIEKWTGEGLVPDCELPVREPAMA